MKKAFCIILIVFFLLALMVLTGCEKVQMTGTEELEEIGSLEKARITSGWDCFGYAAWRATRDSAKYYNKTWGYLPTDDFETGTINDNCIIEWDDHAAYVTMIYFYGDSVKVDEWVTCEIQKGNVYIIGEDHPEVGGEWLRWVKKTPPPPPPDPVWLEIDGPTQLDWDEEGEFEAIAHEGYTPYSNYKWWWRVSGGGPDGKGGGITGPPPGEWQYLGGHEGQSTIEWGYGVSFELKCEVYDAEDNTAIDYHSVTVNQ